MAKKFLTEEGRTRLMAELDDLKTVQRPGIIKRIHEAKEFGELNEGNESDEVRNEQAFIEGRIMMLERLLKDAEVISTHSSDSVGIGSTVRLKSASGENEYTIVGTDEIDLLDGKISNESPLGEALVGRKIGESVTIQTPRGSNSHEILEIS
ncbi:MAG: transcription elongation factor GreA [Chloroflexota bacterium]|nr:transcription elongation factor GreA [Chloroflexota bacterium]MDE2897765.1 transcription elongation factor GreA [Chloroflexota bacterium]